MQSSTITSPMKLLLDTFKPATKDSKLHPSVIALARVYQTINTGNLTVNGLAPDNSFMLGEYLIHGGRICFDLWDLNEQQRQQFINYVLNTAEGINTSHIKKRSFATHGRGGTSIDDRAAEIKLTGTATASDKHSGMDIPIGGEGTIENGKMIKANGKWGHMYIHHDDDLFMIGIEASAPFKKNKRTGERHSLTGTTGKKSTFGADKINHMLPIKDSNGNHHYLSTQGKYNWTSVHIGPRTLELLLDHPFTPRDTSSIEETLIQPPTNAVTVYDPEIRLTVMQDWQDANAKHLILQQKTQEADALSHENEICKKTKTPLWVIAAGLLLTLVGGILLFAPLPLGITQALGGLLIHTGISIAFGVGIGTTLFSAFSRGYAALIGKITTSAQKSVREYEPIAYTALQQAQHAREVHLAHEKRAAEEKPKSLMSSRPTSLATPSKTPVMSYGPLFSPDDKKEQKNHFRPTTPPTPK